MLRNLLRSVSPHNRKQQEEKQPHTPHPLTRHPHTSLSLCVLPFSIRFPYSKSIQMKAIDPATDALIVVDMQNDFVDPATGSLHVPGGETLVPLINALSQKLPFRVQIATQDWHVSNHSSFQSQGGPWPPHCIAGTRGAALCAGLDDGKYNCIWRKGVKQEVDCNSAFKDAAGESTGLYAALADAGVKRVFLVGVALDVCVSATAADALAYNLETVIWEDACKAVAQKASEYSLPKGALVERAADYLPN